MVQDASPGVLWSQRYNATHCSDSVGETWHQKWHAKGCVFLFTVVCTCQNGVFFFLFSCFTCSAHLRTSSAAPQSPLVDPRSTASMRPWPFPWAVDKHKTILSSYSPFFLFSNQLTFLSSSEIALEGQIRAGLRKKIKKVLIIFEPASTPIIRRSYLQSHRLLSLCQRPNERAKSANEVLLNHLFFWGFLPSWKPENRRSPLDHRLLLPLVWIRVILRLLMIWFFYFPPWWACPNIDHTLVSVPSAAECLW